MLKQKEIISHLLDSYENIVDLYNNCAAGDCFGSGNGNGGGGGGNPSPTPSPTGSPDPKQQKLLNCTDTTLNRLNDMINASGDPLRTDLHGLKGNIEGKKSEMLNNIQQRIPDQGTEGSLYGYVAEGMLDWKLAAGTPGSAPLPKPLLRAGINVPGTEIDFVTGSSEASNIVMGEVKTGNQKAEDQAVNARAKFTFAKQGDDGAPPAQRFVYYVDDFAIKPQLKTLLRDAAKDIFPFDPNRDIIRLKEAVPELAECGMGPPAP